MKKYNYEAAQELVLKGQSVVDAAKEHNIPVGALYSYRNQLAKRSKLTAKALKAKPKYLKHSKPTVITVPELQPHRILCFWATPAQIKELSQ